MQKFRKKKSYDYWYAFRVPASRKSSEETWAFSLPQAQGFIRNRINKPLGLLSNTYVEMHLLDSNDPRCASLLGKPAPAEKVTARDIPW